MQVLRFKWWRILVPALLLPVVACEHTFVDDLFDIHKEIDALKESHEDLQQRLDNLNESIVTLQAIVDVLNSGYYIDQVKPISEGNKETGYVISFTNGHSITIHHGNDAVDGHSPIMGVTLIDGMYYWTLDGKVLLDEKGNMIPTLSEEFSTPKFSISNGYWYLSSDGGNTWRLIGKATGEDGDTGEDGIEHFLRVDISSSDEVVFVLADGTSITIPYRVEIRLSMDSDSREGISERETIRIAYTLSNSTEYTRVNVSSDGYYTARVFARDPTSGTISITCPRTYSDGFVNVLVYDKSGIVDTRIIRFYEKKMEFSEGLEFTAPASGGTIEVPFTVNFPYHVQVDSEAVSWLSILDEGNGSQEGRITISAEKNDGTSRTGTLYIIPENSEDVFAAIFITQQSSLCSIDIGSFIIPFEGGTVLSNIKTEYGVVASVPPADQNWMKLEVLQNGENSYTVAISAEPNQKAESRSSAIDILSSDGSFVLASIRILQKGRNLDLEYAMIFVVNPNYSNDFTAYLPIDIHNDFDCFVDWGDGTGAHYRSSDDFNSYPEQERNVHHRYEGLTIGRKFEVVVTGKVTSLNADTIPREFRSSVTEVKQWGKTGLTEMHHAFYGFTGLTTLHLDETGAFENVRSFEGAFQECPRLVTISEHLFDYATKAEYFNNTFNDCHALAVIPENLFRKTTAATSFNATFSNCRKLSSLPGNLFSSCSGATSFNYVFEGCSSLRTLPADLFSRNPEVTSFIGAFRSCRSLEELPAGLFMENTKVEYFSWTFADCHSLTSLPASLLDNQRRIICCQWMFSGCGNVKSESPWTLCNGERIHLYERYNHPGFFVFPWLFEYCFSGCRQMPDYSLIPDNWK